MNLNVQKPRGRSYNQRPRNVIAEQYHSLQIDYAKVWSGQQTAPLCCPPPPPRTTKRGNNTSHYSGLKHVNHTQD